MGLKINFSQVQLDAHEDTLMKFFNTAIEELDRKDDNLTTENAVLKKEMADLKSSIAVSFWYFLKLSQSYLKCMSLMMKILKL